MITIVAQNQVRSTDDRILFYHKKERKKRSNF